jgi:hypothetical protein
MRSMEILYAAKCKSEGKKMLPWKTEASSSNPYVTGHPW